MEKPKYFGLNDLREMYLKFLLPTPNLDWR